MRGMDCSCERAQAGQKHALEASYAEQLGIAYPVYPGMHHGRHLETCSDELGMPWAEQKVKLPLHPVSGFCPPCQGLCSQPLDLDWNSNLHSDLHSD